ncbi:hypothetical protein [Leclercia adecarboxylata]|uniref:hypothetical protein n=1 Tax=Leclercia adecarboxylata TaxID=83655 RepID=UPI0020260D85|nr:hypothetical protein [Leclercia adecarboxylata]URM24029.1 hypothetical protein JJN11_05760 [Leclercia adecarboxylata]
MENSLITSIAAVLFGGGALALFWKPLSAVIASAVTNNRAGGEVITHYKEQVVLLKAANDELRQENNELRERREKDLQRISHLESDIRIIKNSLRMLIAITQAGRDEEFRGQVSSMLSKLEEDRDEI